MALTYVPFCFGSPLLPYTLYHQQGGPDLKTGTTVVVSRSIQILVTKKRWEC